MTYISLTKSFKNFTSKYLYNLTFVLFLVAILLIAVSIFSYFILGLNSSFCFILNFLSLHLLGTVIHDSSHKTAHDNKRINHFVGHTSAFFLGFSFPVFSRVHMQHHAYVNDVSNDPDHFVSTAGPLWLIASRFFYHEVYFFQRKLWRNKEFMEWILARTLLICLLFIAFKTSVLEYVFKCWFCPALLVGFVLGLCFDYLPHYPFKYTDRWHNSCVYPSPLLNLVIFGQNYHLVHHLWPSAPWYFYQKTYMLNRHFLQINQSPQSLGFSLSKEAIGKLLYDFFLGIRI
nr:fatty-acid desaturase [Cyanidiaceae sp.]